MGIMLVEVNVEGETENVEEGSGGCGGGGGGGGGDSALLSPLKTK